MYEVSLGISMCMSSSLGIHNILHLSAKFRPSRITRHSYDVISIFQDGDHGIAILVSVFVSSLTWESRNIPAYQMSARYLDPLLIYCYFRFLKRNVRHVGILLPVSIFTFASSSACHSASAYIISYRSDHL